MGFLQLPSRAVEQTSLTRQNTINSRVSPWLSAIAYPLCNRLVIPTFFSQVTVTGQANVPLDGPVILAPTHRSRWDAILVPYATGKSVTGRDVRFLVTADEVKGLQGWFIRRLGGFPVNPRQPGIAGLRFSIELLQQGEMLVIFPEGGIFRDKQVHPLKPGLARLALQAESSQPGLGLKIVPIHLEYSDPYPSWGAKVAIRIGQPLLASAYSQDTPKEGARHLLADLTAALKDLATVADKEPVLSVCTSS